MLNGLARCPLRSCFARSLHTTGWSRSLASTRPLLPPTPTAWSLASTPHPPTRLHPTSSFSSLPPAMTTPAPSASSSSPLYFPDPYDFHHLLDRARLFCADLVLAALPLAFPAANAASLAAARADVVAKFSRPTLKGRGELTLPCFIFNKKMDPALSLPPPAVAAALQPHLASVLAAQPKADIQRTEAAAAYINFYLSPQYLASVIPLILDGDYLAPLARTRQPKIMVEYSQPNTHKAFHVGHMRNAALGDCLVRLYEQMGHAVVAANYFGDEGAHVAKCLWWLNKYRQANPSFQMDSIPEETRGEWLGGFYTEAVEQLDLGSLTSYPFSYVLAARVLSVSPHPNAKAPKNWRVVRVQVKEDRSEGEEVVCGGIGYAVDDLVAYLPVGAKYKGAVVTVKDMMGVDSSGVMMSEKELGVEAKEEEKKPEDEVKATVVVEEKKEDKGGKKGGGKDAKPKPAKDASLTDAASQRIYLFPHGTAIGVPVTELGRLPTASIRPGLSVQAEWEARKAEVRDTLHGMEHGQAELVSFWQLTRQWSLDEFHRIYRWLGCRFDHDFYESEVSEESRLMANDFYQRGVFVNSNGAVGADLSSFGLGFCMVLKSDGAGLYATKDLALAKRKFEQFGVDQSIYVVDAAQSLHFRQVFKTLELMGYEQARNCQHIAYGQVVLPSGKMSSRAGNVILFSQLRQQLNADTFERFFKDKMGEGEGAWSAEDVQHAVHCIAVATIKYGMLNVDIVRDIVFVMDKWMAKSGNTGPYMLYAYARIRSIIREVQAQFPDTQQPATAASSSASPVDLSLLSHELERVVLTLLHEYWLVVEGCTLKHNPSALCEYLFELSKGFSAWYEQCSILRAESPELRRARLHFIEAIAAVIKNGLGLLGIRTLERM